MMPCGEGNAVKENKYKREVRKVFGKHPRTFLFYRFLLTKQKSNAIMVISKRYHIHI